MLKASELTIGHRGTKASGPLTFEYPDGQSVMLCERKREEHVDEDHSRTSAFPFGWILGRRPGRDGAHAYS